MIQGIDISHQNDINWELISDNIKFVYHKATQGVSFVDPEFNTRWQYLKSTDLLRGCYHFLTSTGTAQQQADNFLSCNVDFSKPNVLPPMLDFEDQVPALLNSQITSNKQAFIQLITDWTDIIQKATGRTVIHYSYKNFFAEYLNNHSWPNPLWIAAYQSQQPSLPVGYSKYTIWQNSQYGHLNGSLTGGDVDMDVFNGTIEELTAL